MIDLVKELRESAEEAYHSGAGLADAPCRLFDEAANEIERLAAKIAGYEVAFPQTSGGYITVPVQPTLEMLNAGHERRFGDDPGPTSEVWAAMIEAAPKSPTT